MDFLSYDKLEIFILLFLPGFICVKVTSMIIAEEKYDFSKNLLEIIGYSILNNIFFSWLYFLNVYHDWIYTHNVYFWISILFSLVIAPILWPFLIKYIVSKTIISKVVLSLHQSPWDNLFAKRKETYWVKIYLKDKQIIGGKYGTKSWSSRFPYKEKIYIEEVKNIKEDGNFEIIDPHPLGAITHGMLIVSEEIERIELYQFPIPKKN